MEAGAYTTRSPTLANGNSSTLGGERTGMHPDRFGGVAGMASTGTGRRALPDIPTGTEYHPRFARRQGEGLATFLGFFSLGLGLAQLTAPDAMARLVGVRPTRNSRNTMRGLGARELSNGLAILTQPRDSQWLWSRLAGDTMDLALLGRAYTASPEHRNRTIGASAAVLGVAALDYMCAQQLRQSERRAPNGNPSTSGKAAGISASTSRRVAHSVTVNHPRQEVFDFWRNLENLPRFMRHLERVQVIDARRSKWTATAPAGTTVEWDAEITEEIPGERISWRSLPDATIKNAGTVRFLDAPGSRGTEVHVEMEYQPPAGMLGASVAMLFREEPKQQVRDDLRAFKQVMELGEVLVSDATRTPGMHPARPSKENAR